MKLYFLGANRQVTGSRYCVEAGGRRVMIDCGLFQERQFQDRNWNPTPVDAHTIDALLLTHVHIDHVGLVPKLVREGFSGPIIGTRPTIGLLDIMLRDSAEIQQEDAAYKKKRHEREGRKGKFEERPLYTVDDVDQTLPLCEGVMYGKRIDVIPGFQATFFEAGHILGSAMIELRVTEEGVTRTIVFSGDIGQWNKPIIRDPTLLKSADYVIMESTYGDRLHKEGGDVEDQMARVINETHTRGGNVVIPTFAVERAQELMYHIGRLVHQQKIPAVKVFLDSPMAVDVTEVFHKFSDCFDEAMWSSMQTHGSPLKFPGLSMVRTAEQSKAINNYTGPCVIMASSGMCNAGRIKHHLRQNIERPESTILFVGHQSEGTLGRQILDRQREVRIHGQNFRVRADIAQIFGFSGHGDRDDLHHWLGAFEKPPKQVFLTHGEEKVALQMAKEIAAEKGFNVLVPEYCQQVVLE